MSQVDPDVSVSQVLRLGLVSLVFLIGGPFLIIRQYMQPVPASLDALTRIEGPVTLQKETQRSRRTTTEYTVLVINGKKYSYLDWFPLADQLPTQLRPGEVVAIWTDPDQRAWVWQIERNGEVIVPFESIRKAADGNAKFNPVLGIVLLLIGIGFAVAFAVKTRPFWATESTPRSSSSKIKKKKKRRKPTRLEELPESD